MIFNEKNIIDCKDYFSYELNFSANNTNIEKIIKYWNTKLDLDCDVSKKTMEQYRTDYKFLSDSKLSIAYSTYPQLQKKYNKDKLKYELQANGKIYTGDTLTSFLRILNMAIRLYCDPNHNINSSKKDVKALSNNICFKQLPDAVENLAKFVHTKGNFIPVPLYINTNRIGKNACWDYADLFLTSIFYWFENNKDASNILQTNDTALEKLFQGNRKAVDSCKNNWLNTYNFSWNDFVSKNKLSSFVEKIDELGNFGKPILLWKNHSLSNTALPNNKKDFEKMILLLNDMIIKRNHMLDNNSQYNHF